MIAEPVNQKADSMYGRPLSERECEVLELVAQGKTNSAIAALLEIAEQTVKHHVFNSCKKLGVTTRTAAVITAMRQGFIHL